MISLRKVLKNKAFVDGQPIKVYESAVLAKKTTREIEMKRSCSMKWTNGTDIIQLMNGLLLFILMAYCIWLYMYK